MCVNRLRKNAGGFFLPVDTKYAQIRLIRKIRIQLVEF